MNIAIVYPYFHKRGGVERYVWELAANLRPHHQITIVAHSWDKEAEAQGYEFIKIPTLSGVRSLSSLIFSLYSYFKLKQYAFDVVHTQGANCLKQDVITAHSCHKAWFLQSIHETKVFSGMWWRKLFNPVHYLTILVEGIQYKAGNYRKIIAISEVVKRELIRYYRVPAADIEVVYNGTNCGEFNPDNRLRYRQEIRNRYRITDGEVILLFAANEFRRKGLDCVLKALPLLDMRRLTLLVVGRDRREGHAKLAAELGISPKVIFAGPSGEISKYYAASDAFVFPTTYEPFGLVITEAMASGLPVITSRLAGAAELIHDKENGLLINDCKNPREIAELIRQVLEPGKRRSLGAMAGKTIEAFTWEAMARQTVAVYKKMHKTLTATRFEVRSG